MITIQDGYVTVGEKSAYLTPTQEKIFLVLLNAKNRFVRTADIYNTAFPDMNTDPGIGQVAFHMYHIRRRIKPLGIKIETKIKRGYRIVPM